MSRHPPLEGERGAILLLALFFAIFALALLFTVIGAAEASFFREHMQDAADSAALSSAIVHARSMNFIVLVNVLMAALLAILVTIKLVEGLVIIGMAVAVALAWFTAGASLAAVPPLKVVQSQMQAAYDAVHDPIFAALEILHGVSDAVKVAGPVAASAAAALDVRAPATSGVVLPAAPELPVADDTFDELCQKAGELPPHIAGELLRPIGIGAIFDALEGPMGDMTRSLSTWFCGDGEKSPPPYEYATDPVEPESKESADCEASSPSSTVPALATTKDCEVARKVEKQSRPNARTGACDEEADCSLDGPYERRVAKARLECDPAKEPHVKYFYQDRQGKRPYFWTGKGWLAGEATYEPPRSETSATPPCARAPSSHGVGAGYNPVVRKSSDVTDVQPVCSSEEPPRAPGDTPGKVLTVAFTEVRHILGCQKHQTSAVSLDVSGDTAKKDGSGSKSPEKVKEGVAMGDEDFQIRAILEGDPSTLEAERIVRLALWGRPAPADPLSGLSTLGRYSVAQAEYFYDGNDAPDAWMWNMRWRARLRRFHVPTEGGVTEAGGSSLVQRFLGDAAGLTDVIAH